MIEILGAVSHAFAVNPWLVFALDAVQLLMIVAAGGGGILIGRRMKFGPIIDRERSYRKAADADKEKAEHSAAMAADLLTGAMKELEDISQAAAKTKSIVNAVTLVLDGNIKGDSQ